MRERERESRIMRTQIMDTKIARGDDGRDVKNVRRTTLSATNDGRAEIRMQIINKISR